MEVRFRDRAMFEFVSLLEKARERAIYMKKQPEEDDETLRMLTIYAPMNPFELINGLNIASYSTPAAGSSTVSIVGGVPVENPPGYD